MCALIFVCLISKHPKQNYLQDVFLTARMYVVVNWRKSEADCSELLSAFAVLLKSSFLLFFSFL